MKIKQLRSISFAISSPFTASGKTWETSTATASKNVGFNQSRSKPNIFFDSKIVTVRFMLHIFEDLKKIRLHLRHGSKTETFGYPRLAGRWSATLTKPPNELIRSCRSALFTPPPNKISVSADPPPQTKHEKSKVDIAFLASTSLMHVIDLPTSWNKA